MFIVKCRYLLRRKDKEKENRRAKQSMKELLLNTLIIFICILCYQVFWLDREGKDERNELLIMLLAAVSVVLCMTFPLRTLSGGYIYDLRFVPTILCFLYGGYRSLIFVSLTYLVYRFYLGGAGFYPATLQYVLLIFIIVCLHFRYPNLLKKRKMMAGIVLTFLASVIFVVVLTSHQIINKHIIEHSLIQFVILYVVINLLTMWASLYLIRVLLEKKELKKESNRSEKMYVLSELAASVAHEIRNPLTVVHGFMQLFSQNQIPENKRQEYAAIMLTELDRAQSIITDYLSFAKPEAEGQERVDIQELIKQVTNIMSPLAALNNVEIYSSLSIRESAYLTANISKIKQCLINIVKNGIEAMEIGGTLRINANERNGQLIIDIIDTGSGMTPEEVNRIGFPFYSTKEKGTGLGTMVCYSIVKGLNGKINVKSEKGKGTCFSIILPLS
jgi:two-component system, sporulation sensor kinase B